MRRVGLVQAGTVVACAVLACALLAGCGNGGGDGNGAPPVSLEGNVNNRGTKTASKTMEVELDEFSFGPSFIKAEPGQRIEIELKNEGEAVHTFTSPELGDVDEQLAGGTSKRITVTAPQRGHVVFVCRFHQTQGMQGAVFVA